MAALRHVSSVSRLPEQARTELASEERGVVITDYGKPRGELFAREIFDSVFEARVLFDDWCDVYNRIRPHSSLGYMPPAVYAAAVGGQKLIRLRLADLAHLIHLRRVALNTLIGLAAQQPQ